MGAHDSSFLRDSSTSDSLAGNQYYNATIALSSGIRMLQAQVHNLNGTLELCHTTCTLLDAGPLETWLTKIKFWMDNNPNEVITLLLVNSDNEDAATFGSAFESSNISTYGYTPTSSSATKNWPTLQSMIDANTRLVTFIASLNHSSSYPYLLDEFTYVFENPYDVTNSTGFNCTLDRPASVSSASSALGNGMMPLMNHFLDVDTGLGVQIPDTDDIATTNSPATDAIGALGTHAQTCVSAWGQKPVFVLVDFYNQGPSVATADSLNGITAVGRSGTAASAANASRRSSSSTGMGGTVAMVAFLAIALFLV